VHAAGSISSPSLDETIELEAVEAIGTDSASIESIELFDLPFAFSDLEFAIEDDDDTESSLFMSIPLFLVSTLWSACIWSVDVICCAVGELCGLLLSRSAVLFSAPFQPSSWLSTINVSATVATLANFMEPLTRGVSSSSYATVFTDDSAVNLAYYSLRLPPPPPSLTTSCSSEPVAAWTDPVRDPDTGDCLPWFDARPLEPRAAPFQLIFSASLLDALVAAGAAEPVDATAAAAAASLYPTEFGVDPRLAIAWRRFDRVPLIRATRSPTAARNAVSGQEKSRFNYAAATAGAKARPPPPPPCLALRSSFLILAHIFGSVTWRVLISFSVVVSPLVCLCCLFRAGARVAARDEKGQKGAQRRRGRVHDGAGRRRQVGGRAAVRGHYD
jgi:hypothetical protein